ncbi:MAG: hypothetical protein J5I50_13260 [Chitinophagaceae bacterium]|nr:hypothetical protein [Chitinophagaceae bacterium]
MKTSILTLYLLLLSISVFAQTLRDPTSAEKAALNKVVNAVMPVLQPFADEDWILMDGGADNPEDYSVQIKPDVVMGAAPFSDMTYTLKQESPLWIKEVKPLMDRLTDPANTPHNDAESAAYDKLSDEIEAKSEVIIQIHVNEKNLGVKPIKGSKEDLKIPGCYFSYKPTKDPGTNEDLTNEYVLAFGNWKTFKEKDYSGTPFYEFSFTHPNGSPYIENIVIILKGNIERIKAMIKKIDWNKINQGLTL